ncbi:MAG TPA: alpha/beta fold hydrolase [Xanthobacteraceae bacterium]|nr:alpha/beta fold hydrolase [Xanthobacteraceae bacterium]
MRASKLAAALAFIIAPLAAGAADYPAPKQGEWTIRDFKFHSGEVMPQLRMSYLTIGDPAGQPVLVLHGTSQFGGAMLTPAFAGELFGPGQPLDASKYFIIIPDSLGHGKSSRPSEGLRAKFPHYNYDDMVEAQYRLITEGLGVKHLRLVIGNSMGGMHTWLWGEKYPAFMDALAPMASQPTAMAARNWMLRRLMLETIRRDPEYADGNYTAQPHSLKLAALLYATATSGGTLAWQAAAPTGAAADKIVDERLNAPFPVDANDYVYAFDSARDYDPAPSLEKIEAAVLCINSADDERNPPETGATENALKRITNARLLLIPASTETRGHGTTAMAKFYAGELAAFLAKVPQRAM